MTVHQATQALELHQQGRNEKPGHQVIVKFGGTLANAQMEMPALTIMMLPEKEREEEDEDVPVPDTMTEESHLVDIQEKVVYRETQADHPAPQVQADSAADHQEVEGQHHQVEHEEDPQLGETLSARLEPKKERGVVKRKL